MNTFRKITATLAVALCATVAMAQNSVEQAIKSFVDGKSYGKYITANNYQEAQEDESLPKSYYREYKFNINKKSKQFEQLREAFEEGQCEYYKKVMKPAGEIASTTWNVGYGAQSESTVQFGTHKDRNYALLYCRDNGNAKWRTVYGLVWYNNKENDDNYNGSLHIIYSPDPKKMERKSNVKVINWNDFNKSMDELDASLAELDESLAGLDTLKFNHNFTVIDPDGTVTTNSNVIHYDPNEYVNSAEQFLTRFGTLRSLYLDAGKKQRSASYKTSIINKVLSLCKNKASLLSADEKKACAYGIKEMQDRTYAEYDKRLLDIALKALK